MLAIPTLAMKDAMRRFDHAPIVRHVTAVGGSMMLTAALLVGCGSNFSKSTDNNLSNLTVSVGTLSPAFSAAVTNYGVSVPPATPSVTVIAATSSSKATFQVVGVAVPSGSPSPPQPLVSGFNLIDIAVFAEDGSVRIYDVTVSR
jgi:hypothetical protein